MSGSCRRRNGGESHPITFTIVVRARSWLRYLLSRRATIEGRITISGVATDRPLEGELTIDPVLGRVIDYRFEFPGDHNKRFRLAGTKRIDWTNVRASFTELPAIIYEGDVAIADAELKFDLAKLAQFVAAFRPWY